MRNPLTDEPTLLRPGVKAAESDFPGNDKFLALPPEHPERMAKGDLGTIGLPESHATDANEPPFVLKPKV
jgi:hypothetical protein